MTDSEKKLTSIPCIIHGNMTINETFELLNKALEQLEQYRELGTVEEFKAYKLGDCMNDCEHYDICANYINSKGYNKAIDEFATRIYNKLGCSEKDIYCIDTMEKILEQMKGGATDEC